MNYDFDNKHFWPVLTAESRPRNSSVRQYTAAAVRSNQQYQPWWLMTPTTMCIIDLPVESGTFAPHQTSPPVVLNTNSNLCVNHHTICGMNKTSYRPVAGETIFPTPMSVRLAADPQVRTPHISDDLIRQITLWHGLTSYQRHVWWVCWTASKHSANGLHFNG